MVDVHCHILPGIDDGALDMADSVAMGRQAADDGIEIVCATPHIRHDHDVRIHELAERADEVNAELERLGVAVRVEPAGEVAETSLDGLDPDELAVVAIGGRWILLEPAPGPIGDSLAEAVDELSRLGYRSLVAHPERHAGPDLQERLGDLVRRGALIQMTADMLAAGPASAGMLALARRGLVHVLGSDAHTSHAGRPVRLSHGLDRLREADPLGPHLGWIGREAPRAILAGADVEPPYQPSP